MSVRRAGLAWVAVAAAGALLAAIPATGQSAPSSAGPVRVIPDCSRLNHSALVFGSRSSAVRVWRSSVPGDGGRHDWACAGARSGSATPLGTTAEGGFAPGVRVGQFLARGPWLVDVASSRRGWRSGFPVPGRHPAPRVHHEIELTDVAGGEGARRRLAPA